MLHRLAGFPLTRTWLASTGSTKKNNRLHLGTSFLYVTPGFAGDIMTLHITNGDIIADRIRAIGIEGYILPWREVLHEGTLADYVSVDAGGRHQFNLNRAVFIESRGWGRADEVVQDMDRRDAILLDAHWKEVVIWMESDLFDQLIMAQVLTILYRSGRFARTDVRLVQSVKHLNYLMDSELVSASRSPTTITSETIAPYLTFWKDVAGGCCFERAVGDPEPLQTARKQWVELQPGDDGLSCFDKRVLDMVQRRGKIDVDLLFQQINAEDGHHAFWADTAFSARLHELAEKVPSFHLHGKVAEYMN